MKYFVVSDVHGFYNEFMTALTSTRFDPENPNHMFVNLGDLMDRGDGAQKCLEYVNRLPRKILIRGNHELLIENCALNTKIDLYDYTNGTANTISQLTGVEDPEQGIKLLKYNEEYEKYIESCKFFHETNSYIFVHGWIPCERFLDFVHTSIAGAHQSLPFYRYRNLNGDWRVLATPKDWENATWTNGMEAWAAKVRDKKTIVCGHWHTSWGHSKLHYYGVEFVDEKTPKGECAHFEPFIDDGIIAIDACTAYSHKVNCIVLED